MINRTLGLKGRLWQKGYYDRAVRKDEDVKHMARYVVQNPIRAGLVHRVHDYPLWDSLLAVAAVLPHRMNVLRPLTQPRGLGSGYRRPGSCSRWRSLRWVAQRPLRYYRLYPNRVMGARAGVL